MTEPVFEVNYTLPSDLPYPWCSAYGEDSKGIWAEFSVQYGEGKKNKVKQRMRWINPGRFTMGSPEGELKRGRNENQHEVTLTKGFWLADTACTQELWNAVMGNNPSYFKGQLRPVDNICWVNCQEFLSKINNLPELLGITLCLPSEAQWEYACRAGAMTPFSLGKNIIPNQVNYNGNYPYSGGKKGMFREEAVDVKSLPPNSWGLYEIHGNVWEWCNDWFGAYPIDQVADPIGYDQSEFCVLRGGSWNSDATECRSASRKAHASGLIHNLENTGFRLSRGQ